MIDQTYKVCLMDLTDVFWHIKELPNEYYENVFFVLAEVRLKQKYGSVFEEVERP